MLLPQYHKLALLREWPDFASFLACAHFILAAWQQMVFGKMNKVKCFRNWMIDTATVLFDDNHNDLRALPKTVRLQLLVVLSFVWSTVFTVYFFSIATMVWGWVGLVVGHLGVIFAMYYTFKQFHNKPYKREPDKDEPPMYDDIWGA